MPGDVDKIDERGWTKLMHAVASGDVERVKLLIANGADPDYCIENDLSGDSPLSVVLYMLDNDETKLKYIEIFYLLIACGANFTQQVEFAAECDSIKEIKEIKEYCKDIDTFSRKTCQIILTQAGKSIKELKQMFLKLEFNDCLKSLEEIEKFLNVLNPQKALAYEIKKNLTKFNCIMLNYLEIMKQITIKLNLKEFLNLDLKYELINKKTVGNIIIEYVGLSQYKIRDIEVGLDTGEIDIVKEKTNQYLSELAKKTKQFFIEKNFYEKSDSNCPIL